MTPSASPGSVSATAATLSIRLIDSADDYVACVKLQQETWGSSNRTVVPTPILKIANRIGGVTAGAFDGDQLVGFVFGIPGAEEGRVIHWSHILAVHPRYRDLGIGRRLKELQFEIVWARGVDRVYWTYDPLVARNAYFNLCRLGVEVRGYEEDVYAGAETEFLDYGTDRFIVVHDLRATVKARPRASEPIEVEQGHVPIVNPDGHAFRLDGFPPAVRVEIPADIHAVRAGSLEDALRWRASTRHAFQYLLANDHRVSGFLRDRDTGRCFYILLRDDA